MNINEIKNGTIAKLTAEEVGALGLLNEGIATYRGQLKARRSGYKVSKVSEFETDFDSGIGLVAQFIKLADTSEAMWAMRIYDTDKCCYVKQFNILAGCNFIR